MTPYGQRVLDLICERVADAEGFGMVGRPVGRTADVVRAVAEVLGQTVRSVAGALSQLEEDGLLEPVDLEPYDNHTPVESGWLCVSQTGWQAYSKWSPRAVRRIWSMTLAEWREWDGLDGCGEISYRPPFPDPESPDRILSL